MKAHTRDRKRADISMKQREKYRAESMVLKGNKARSIIIIRVKKREQVGMES